MKICKNCGKATEDEKVRCPYCGYLFEEDLDSVLSKMKSNLSAYKAEVSSAAPVQAAQPAQARPAEPAQYGADISQRERFDLLTEVAQLKGELKVLHGELDRMNSAQPRYAAQPAPETAPAAPAFPQAQSAPQAENSAAPQPAPMQQAQPVQAAQPVQPVQPIQPVQPVYYAQAYPPMPYAQQPYAAQPLPAAQENKGEQKKKKGVRSANRVVISIVALIMLGLSIAAFFFPWTKGTYEFSGWDAVKNLYEKFANNGSNEKMQAFLDYIRTVHFADSEWVANLFRTVCYRVMEFGIPLYFLFLVLSFPLLFSMFGKVRFKGWHLFFAWLSLLTAAALAGIFYWVGQFNALTTLCMAGACANVVRVLFLFFYKGKKRGDGGAE